MGLGAAAAPSPKSPQLSAVSLLCRHDTNRAAVMTRMGRITVGAASVAMVVVAGCSSSQSNDASSGDSAVAAGSALAERVEEDALVGHLEQLESIAGDNNGNRASGTSGYDASVDYIAGQLRDAGFEVDTPEFDFDQFIASTQTLTADGTDIPIDVLEYSPSTPDTGLTARLAVAPAGSLGCAAEDWGDVDLAGAVALVDRGTCPFSEKAKVAADRGAVGLIVANNEDGPIGGTLGGADAAAIPVGGVTREIGEQLRSNTPAEVVLTLETETSTSKTRNVIAQTSTGSTDNVVVVGAHLDSVEDGPGINDNGSGVAAVVETAKQLGADPDITNAVRFAFWGAEELGLVGSYQYVEGLSDDERNDIALYLNYDMVGSSNAGYLIYDGDDSDREGAPGGPEGSAGVERVSEIGVLNSGVGPNGTDFDGRSDYAAFIEAGIPAGGVFSGADESKTELQAELWGGTAGEPFDPNYHTADDTVANINREALIRNSQAAAFAVGAYAQSVEGANGVPVGEARTKARAETQ